MAVFQLFPKKDTTLYSGDPSLNAGLDEIVELSSGLSTPETSSAARILIQFDTEEIQNVVNNKIGSNPYKTYLRLYCSEVENIPSDLTIKADPVYSVWDMGTGRADNIPFSTNGASWVGPTSGSLWLIGDSTTVYTSSAKSYSPYGGDWYKNYTVSQSISQFTSPDIWIDVTNIITSQSSAAISNNGIILRVGEGDEFSTVKNWKLSYFSRDTNTIYSPSLIFNWNDQIWPSDSWTKVLDTGESSISLGNSKSSFYNNENVKFRVYGRKLYPERTFVTQSLYTQNKVLPFNSWYQIVDTDTNDIVIPYDSLGTRISSDVSSSYFYLDMDGFEPERYYTIQIRAEIPGSSEIVTWDSSLNFKVTQKVGPGNSLVSLSPPPYPTPSVPSTPSTPTYSSDSYFDVDYVVECYVEP